MENDHPPDEVKKPWKKRLGDFHYGLLVGVVGTSLVFVVVDALTKKECVCNTELD